MVDEIERLFLGYDPQSVRATTLHELRENGAQEVWGIDQRPRQHAAVEALMLTDGCVSAPLMAVNDAYRQNGVAACGFGAVGLLKPDEREVTLLSSGTQIGSQPWKKALADFQDAVREGRVVWCDRSYERVGDLFGEIQEARYGRGFNPIADPASLHPLPPALWRAALAGWARVTR